MKKYKVLTLTDHSNHSAENSVYALINGFIKHPACQSMDIASRGNPLNASFFEDGSKKEIYAKTVDLGFAFDPTGEFLNHDCKLSKLDDYDIIFMRLPRPISDSFLNSLKSNNKKAIFINNPFGIIKTSSKAFLLNFPDLCPPIKLCRSVEDVMEFSAQFPIVLKPLREYGGKGIIKIDGNMINTGNEEIEVSEYLKGIENELKDEGFLAMKFLKNVDQGDKRLIVVNGQILAASLRLPPKGSWLCNVAQGGTSVSTQADEDEISLVSKISPDLLKEGIFIYGADTLVDDRGKRVLSEINTLSIGGFPQSEKQTGKPIIQLTIELIFNYVNRQQ